MDNATLNEHARTPNSVYFIFSSVFLFKCNFSFHRIGLIYCPPLRAAPLTFHSQLYGFLFHLRVVVLAFVITYHSSNPAAHNGIYTNKIG